MPNTINEWLMELAAKYGDRRAVEFQREEATITLYIEKLLSELRETYSLDTILAVGGTGIVFRGAHRRFNQAIVLKLNRPNIAQAEMSMVENEAQILQQMSHPNIIRILDLGHVVFADAPKMTYVIEPFIEGSKPFFTSDPDHAENTWLKQRIRTLQSLLPRSVGFAASDDTGKAAALLNSFLADLGSLFSQWVSLLAHLHVSRASAKSGYVYLDVKPENVLIDDHRHLTSIDYGSVEHLDRADHSPLQVFFTKRYAHPFLLQQQTDKASSNRVRSAVKRSDLRHALDYYALGVSMLEILNEVVTLRPHLVPQLPLYRSLHFLATRLLDGQNSSKRDDNRYPNASQVFPTLRDADYVTLRYSNLTDALRDLAKERGQWSLEEIVPELATYSKDIVRLVPGFNTVLTPRLRGVIEHPLVARLKYVTQLGLVALVYPTADHARYDHALGAYTYTTNYVKSLFNDLGNPIFRNLVGVEDLNAVLLAALLHDLGQYPLAHDLEEVHEGIFKHSDIGLDLLEDSTIMDAHGRTLLGIIEDPENGWGVSEDVLRQIWRSHSRNIAKRDNKDGDKRTSKKAAKKVQVKASDVNVPLDLSDDQQVWSLKTEVLAAIIDGPVDADKADYIVRDSERCELPYGSQLDIERLLRVLTVAIIPEETWPVRRVTLGVYDKGLVSAHAFGLARYQLLATVYWHHTVRIAKAMLQYATALGLPLAVFGPTTSKGEAKTLEIRERLLAFLKSLAPPFRTPGVVAATSESEPTAAVDLTEQPPTQVLDAVAGADVGGISRSNTTVKADWYPGIAWTDWLMLQWIAGLDNASVNSRNLIGSIQGRRLYKRIATFSRDGAYQNIIAVLDEHNNWPAKIELCKKIHDKVATRLRREWENLPTTTGLSLSEFEMLCRSNLLILIDVPNPKKKVGYDRPLGVVPELKEKSYQQEPRQAMEDRPWRDIMESMIKGIAPVRVLCHPAVRNLVSFTYTPVEKEMAKLVAEALGISG